MEETKLIEITKCEFVFMQSGEFDDPFYQLMLNGQVYGSIRYCDGVWYGSLSSWDMHSSGTFMIISKKIDELNASLDKQRKEFFGLI